MNIIIVFFVCGLDVSFFVDALQFDKWVLTCICLMAGGHSVNLSETKNFTIGDGDCILNKFGFIMIK